MIVYRNIPFSEFEFKKMHLFKNMQNPKFTDGTLERARMLDLSLEYAADFPPATDWPPWLAHTFGRAHRTYADRVTLMVFFANNGMDPTIAAEIIAKTDTGLDASALAHLQSLIKSTTDHTIAGNYWNLYERRKVTLTPRRRLETDWPI